MFKKLTILLFFVASCAELFAQVTDNFNDGDYTVSPTWTPSSGTDFKDTLGMLRSNNVTASSNYYISTPSSTASGQWEFFVNLKFATSSANYVDAYLIADNANLLSASLNGYFVRIGNTSDEISLYKNLGGSITEIIDGLDGIISSSSNNLIKIKVTRDGLNQFVLQRDMSGAGTAFTTEGTVVDSDILTSTHFGFLIRQSTASFFKKHFFDDVYAGPIIVDTAPPTLVSATPTGSTTLDVLFNEPLDPTTSQTSLNYSVNNSIGNPSSAIQDGTNPALMHLTFAASFVNLTTYELIVDNVSDVLLNPMDNDTLSFFYFIADTALPGDVIINEILCDETPQVGLPAAEFVELYNKSSKYFDLNGWTFSDGGTPATMGSKILGPGQYIILCDDSDTIDYSLFGNTIGVTTFPNLNLAGDPLDLKNNFGTTIDAVTYSDTWYQDPAKDDGGYSLELINPNAAFTCPESSNWIASNHGNGGTPGAINSVYSIAPDTSAPIIVSGALQSTTTLLVTFSEALDTTLSASFLFSVSGGLTIGTITFDPVNQEQVTFTFTSPAVSGIVYTLFASNINDCVGNNQSSSFDFVIPANEIIINEILFAPESGVSEFVEFYNNGTIAIDLNGWQIAKITNDTIGSHEILFTSPMVLNPGEYIALTENKNSIVNYYTQAQADRVVEVADLPSYDNDSATVILVTNLNTVSDRFSYSDAMHFQLLTSFNGVSLERMDFNRPTNDAGNWHSAAEQVGFATPGYLNSQYYPNEITGDELTLGNDLFSPDNDGYQDVMNFNFKFTEPGYVANATVYDAKGRLIKRLVKSELLGAEGTFTWDGLNEKTEKAALGIYVLYFEYFNLTGETKKIKKSFVLAGKF